MRLTIHAKPGAREDKVIPDPDDPTHLTVRTTQPADKGRANEAVLRLVGAHLGVPVSRLTLVSGRSARVKRVNVDE